MKVSLVVATGVHQGKVVPILGSQFLVGRDPECQLRPASQAVSKQHCAVLVRDGNVYLKDFGSTNGTVLNEAIVKGEERLLRNNDSVKIGPLDFTIRIEASASKPDGTPLPDMNPETAAALAAVKAAAGADSRTPAPKNPTPIPKAPALNAAEAAEEAEHDRFAAMLLGLDDGMVPDGSTVVDMPVPAGATSTGEPAKEEEKAAAKKPVANREDTSSAASEILRRYMKRPR